MWIEMKTFTIQLGQETDTILMDYMNDLNNAFELYESDIQKSTKNTKADMDLILLKAVLTSIEIKKTNSSKTLIKKQRKKYLVSFTNVKNQKGEYFSSIIDNLFMDDRIIISNVVVLKQYTSANLSTNLSTILVRPQNNSSVILFRVRNPFEEPISRIEKNLSLLIGPGVYSSFGKIQQIVKCGEELMALRLQSCDETVLKTLTIYNFFNEFKNDINSQTTPSMKYNFSSNIIDILVITPSNDFTSLSLNETISLNNLKVKNIHDSDIFLLFINGYSKNIIHFSKDIVIVRPPIRYFSAPDESKPAICSSKFKQLTSDVQLVLKNSILEVCTNKGHISPNSSLDSFSFFNIQSNILIFDQETQSNVFQFNFENQPTHCIGPCRLIYTEPNIFDHDEIVSGYCIKCSAFVQKHFLNETTQSSNIVYNCPKCFSIVHLTYFVILHFLYGNNESKAIKVYCYDKKVEYVIKKISKEIIDLEKYLSHPTNRKLANSILKSLIRNKTQVNIIVCLSPVDNKNILLGIDAKYVVTNPEQ